MHLFRSLKDSLRLGMLRVGITSPLVRKLASSMRVMGPEDAEFTLLALKPERFRGDLDILADEFGFRILSFEKGWQQKLLELSWGRDFKPDHSYYHPEKGSELWKKQQGAREVLRTILPSLLKYLGVDCVLGAATYYLDDWDYCAVLGELRFPYVVIYRECFQASEKDVELQTNLGLALKDFPGTHILVHNETTRKTFIDCGLVEPERISAPGCMRMDPFLRKLAEGAARERKRPLITLFSFVPCALTPQLCTDFTPGRDVGFVRLFDEVHQEFARAALEHPELDFLIKPKWGGNWIEEIDFTLEQEGLNRADIPNLVVDPNVNPQEAILDSEVVVGFGSTVLCEAAIAGKPVIIPHFAEATEEEYGEYVLLREYFDAFDIAESREHMSRLMFSRLAAPQVSPEVMQRRRELFERYISPVKGGASEAYAAAIKSSIWDHRRKSPVIRGEVETTGGLS
ncbi:MAG: hypothetical protein AB7D51_06715 [Desulfovibrionaceae bacterium]